VAGKRAVNKARLSLGGEYAREGTPKLVGDVFLLLIFLAWLLLGIRRHRLSTLTPPSFKTSFHKNVPLTAVKQFT
jgi:hypothetical protein